MENKEQRLSPVSSKIYADNQLFFVLSAVALLYAFLAGLRTVSDYDVFWQLATGRWIAQHHTVFSTDVFSYTATGQPWIYPVGSGLLFYLVFLVGGYAAISWLGAIACVGTVALLLRHGSTISAAIAIIAIPTIAARTAPRADLFTVLMFAAFLSILWEEYQTGHGKLWLLPLLMVAWVNLHLGFVAGLVLLGAYMVLEAVRFFAAAGSGTTRTRWYVTLAWLGATFLATLLNPWSWHIYQALARQQEAMAVHSERITEWAAVSFQWATLQQALDFRDPSSASESILAIGIVGLGVAFWRRQWAGAALLSGSLWMATRHVRFFALLGCVVVVVGGSVLASAITDVRKKFASGRWFQRLAIGGLLAIGLLAGIRSYDLVSNRYYFRDDSMESFGAGLSSWFPEAAVDFIKRERLPAEIFNGYEVGGFLVWTLGPEYRDYVDGRAIPFGPDLFRELQGLLQSPPNSNIWQSQVQAYGINTVLLSVARHDGLRLAGSALRSFCDSADWQPVYLDEVSAIFVRRSPETVNLLNRFPVDCAKAALPAGDWRNREQDFNRWANAAALLLTLERNEEAETAGTRALSIFKDSAALWYIRGKARLLDGHPQEAEQDLLKSAKLQTSVATWAELADLYERERQFPAALNALKQLAVISPDRSSVLMVLSYTYLEAGQPANALRSFDDTEKTLSGLGNNIERAELESGRALCWKALGNLGQAISLEEKAVQLSPQVAVYWKRLAQFYELAGRLDDAQKARETAALLASGLHP